MKTVVHPGIMLYDISWIPAVFFQAGTRKGQDSSMKWLDTLERKFDRFSIGNLMQYICLTMAALYIFAAIQPNVPIFSLIALSPYRIMQGQIWRLVTFIFMPPSSGLFAFVAIYFYYWLGQNLEYYWGTTRFNLYYLFGMIGAIIAAFITNSTGTSDYLNLSLLLACAALFPDTEVLFMFLIPMKMKWLGIIDAVLLGWLFIIGNIASRVSLIFSLINFLIFFGPKLFDRIRYKMRYEKFRRQMRQPPKF